MAESNKHHSDKTENKADKKRHDTVASAEDVELEPVVIDDLTEYEIEQAEQAIELAQEEYGASDTNPDVVNVRNRVENAKTAEEGLTSNKEDKDPHLQKSKHNREFKSKDK